MAQLPSPSRVQFNGSFIPTIHIRHGKQGLQLYVQGHLWKENLQPYKTSRWQFLNLENPSRKGMETFLNRAKRRQAKNTWKRLAAFWRIWKWVLPEDRYSSCVNNRSGFFSPARQIHHNLGDGYMIRSALNILFSPFAPPIPRKQAMNEKHIFVWLYLCGDVDSHPGFASHYKTA